MACKRFAIYSRKSRFTGKGESIENQVALCRQYIAAHAESADVEVAIYEDEGFSGGNLARPQFQRMMRDQHRHAFDAIVCYRLDRVSRNIGDFAHLIELLDRQGTAFVSIKEQFDTSSPMGRAMMYICSVFSQLERETIAERIRDNMIELSKTGRWLGGVTPTGYASESVEIPSRDGKPKKAYKLTIVPVEAEIVRAIFAQYRASHSLTGVETFLLQSGAQTKFCRPFTRFSVRNILTNPVYMIADDNAYEYWAQSGAKLCAERDAFDGIHGIMAYNRTVQKAGKANQVKPVDEWILSVGQHVGLIPGKEWIHVQQMLARNRSKSYRKPRSNVALLSGVLRCGQCGAYMRPKQSNRYDEKGRARYAYLCTQKEKSRKQKCDAKNACGNALDDAVLDALQAFEQDRMEFIQRLETGRKTLIENASEPDVLIERLKKKQQETMRDIRALVGTLAKAVDTPSETYIRQQIDALHEEGAACAARIAEWENDAGPHTLSSNEFETIRDDLTSFGGALARLDVEPKRAVIQALIRDIVWDGETAHIYPIGTGERAF